MDVQRSSICLLVAGVLAVGGCAAPWRSGGDASTSGDTTATPSGEASSEPLVHPEERRTRTDTPEAVQAGTGDTDPRIAPEGLQNSERARELARRAYRAFEAGDTDHALSLFRRAARHDPENVAILSNIGSLNYRLGNFRAAVKAYRKALKVDPEDYFAHFYTGVTYYRMGKRTRARHHFQRAAEIRPNRQEPQKWLQRLTGADGTPGG